ncbi:ribonuclease UK114-like [Sinocyclocheilus grahami]|uniref:ribonuclease UK114-like n=1 Tax=Sinocyclocheilus grahami TaxID=75366 RepID=UPI0007ACCC6A|nr:PREDICTED: ribonuclease UK114-like [Sinocyclocheilus grahami]
MSAVIRKIIHTAAAPAAIGPYREKSHIHLKPLLDRTYTVVKATVLLTDINDFNNVNDVYKQFFKSSFPARAAYQVAALHRGGLVEIEAVAVLGPITDAP